MPVKPAQIVTLELPTPPNRANDSSGWRGRQWGFKQYLKESSGYVAAFKNTLPKEASPLWTSVKWVAEMEVPRLMDADNLVSRLKWAFDAVVKHGLLIDDGPTYSWPVEFPKQIAKSKGPCMTRITFHIFERRSEV